MTEKDKDENPPRQLRESLTIQQAESRVIVAEATAIGMATGLGYLFEAHARLLGGTEEAILRTREIIESSLDELTISATSATLSPDRAANVVRNKITGLVSVAEREVRKKLGLSATSE